ncbi:hypothetical protein [Streptomyces sp. NPDC004728]|uniref:hypothetical protein n=1 Tax=Streptomyces sp. NPDC004728 TaxID=3154289 RepID=UPI0033B434BC
MKRAQLLWLGALAAGLVVAMTASPVNAAPAYQGDDFAIHSYDARTLTVCDVEKDGHSVWAGYYIEGGSSYQTASVLYDDDPNSTDCTEWGTFPIRDFRVVEDNPDSSSNYYGPYHGEPVYAN